jgi:hypothetical protein
MLKDDREDMKNEVTGELISHLSVISEGVISLSRDKEEMDEYINFIREEYDQKENKYLLFLIDILFDVIKGCSYDIIAVINELAKSKNRDKEVVYHILRYWLEKGVQIEKARKLRRRK